MARSGSYDFNVTRNDIIQGALRLIGVLGTDQTPSTVMYDEGSQALNMMVKAWTGRGFGLWLNKEVVLFVQKDQVKYRLGPTMQSNYGDYACLENNYVKTEVGAAAAAADVNLTVDSISGITNGDYIGVETDNEDIHWTTVNGVPAGTTVVLATGLDYDSAVDSHVYTYTSVIQRPLQLLKVWRRDNDMLDVDIEIISLDTYRSQTNKLSESPTTTMCAYDKQLDDGIIWLWPEPSDMKYEIHLIAKYPIQDFDVSTDDPDFPQEWFAALKYNLAIHLAPEYSRMPSPLVMQLAASSIEDARGMDIESASTHIVPDITSYRRR